MKHPKPPPLQWLRLIEELERCQPVGAPANRDAGQPGSIMDLAGNDSRIANAYWRLITEQIEPYFGGDWLVEPRGNEPRGVSSIPTEKARELARVIRPFFEEVEAVIARGRAGERTYRIGARESFLQWLVIPGIGESILDAFPDCSFRLFSLQNGEIIRGLEDRTLDFGLLRGNALKNTLSRWLLGEVRYILAVPMELMKNWPAEQRADWRAVVRELPLAVRLETAWVQRALEEAALKEGIVPLTRVRCDTFPSAMAALQTKACATFMIDFGGTAEARRPLPEGVLAVPLPCLQHASQKIYLAWLPRILEVKPRTSVLLEALHRSLAWTKEAKAARPVPDKWDETIRRPDRRRKSSSNNPRKKPSAKKRRTAG